MGANLFIIEAPGKRRGLFDVLRRAGVRDIDIEATVGHIAGNPDGFKPLGIDAQCREMAYRIKPDRERVALSIAAKAADARRIYLATDDDQEGDVIARDALRLCIPEEHRHKAVRMRLKSLSLAEVQEALRTAQPFDELLATHGDARRIIDRLIGSLSNDAGAVGRVQGSLLLALADQKPVVGVVTHTLAAQDGKRPFVAQVPVLAGQPVPEALQLQGGVVAVTEKTTMATTPMNHDDILLAASLRLDASVQDVDRAMQSLYERGRMSYPRPKDSALSSESLRRLAMVARANGAQFNPNLFGAVRSMDGVHAHEAPNPMVLDVPVNRNIDLLPLDEQVLVTVTQHLIDIGIEARLDRPDVGSLPAQAQGLDWRRVVPVATRLWKSEPVVAGMQKWTQEQSLLHFMIQNNLGRPSTISDHISKFLTRNLVTQEFDFTRKGREWLVNLEALIGHRNISAPIEEFIENNRKSSSEMVMDMLELLELHSVKNVLGNQQEFIVNDASEEFEVSSGNFP